MNIRMLEKDLKAPVKIVLKKDEGLLLLENSHREHDCVILSDMSAKGPLDLTLFNNAKVSKYIGGKKLLLKIKNKLGPLFFKKITRAKGLLGQLDIWYFPENGSVKYLKSSALVDLDIKEDLVPQNSFKTIPFKKKKLLLVDDSKTVLKILTKIFSKSTKLEVYATASCPSEARKIIEKNPPDLITLDVHMPEMTGVEFLKTYVRSLNIPTAMITSVSFNEGPLILEALSNGAATYIQKPSLDELGSLASVIIERVEAIIDYKSKPINSSISASKKKILSFNNTEGMVAIGSSTGGTKALEDIFVRLPNEIPPMIVVQHIPPVFSKALAERLNTLCSFTVKEAAHGDILQKNTIYLAPGGKQMKAMKKGAGIELTTNDDPPVNRFRPSVDYFFNSLTLLKSLSCVGVILTGMGRDGADGLLGLKNKGAYTIAQDEESSVVFGMPKAAIELGAAEKIVSLDDMAEQIVQACNKSFSKKAA